MSNVTRICRLCAEAFLRAAGGFDVICERCHSEQDNQTLEDALAMTGGRDDANEDVGRVHTPGCRAIIDPDLGCSCGTEDLDPEALNFTEAENY